jgi:uncharacterized protein YpbB
MQKTKSLRGVYLGKVPTKRFTQKLLALISWICNTQFTPLSMNNELQDGVRVYYVKLIPRKTRLLFSLFRELVNYFTRLDGFDNFYSVDGSFKTG